MKWRIAVMMVSVVGALVTVGTALAQGEEGSGAPAIDQLSDFTLWGIAAGFIGTFIVAVINRARWSSALKFAVFFVWCLVSAGVDAALTRELDLHNWVRAVLVVFVAGQATYLAGKSAVKQVEAATG